MYHVVVCSNCKYVWIVKDRPKTSQCGKCRKRRKFKLLKKYHKTTDKDEAKLARAFYQSRVHDQGERFDEALEAGVLEEDMDAFLSETEYLDMQGIDADAVEDAVDNIISPSNKRSEVRIIQDAFRELDDPDIDEFLEYTREYDVSDENAVMKLEGLARSGTIDPGIIQISDIEDTIDDLFNEPDVEERPAPDDIDQERGSGSSHHDIIVRAVKEHGDDSVDAILDQAEAKGMDRQKAVISLEKLALSGQVDLGVDLQAISDARISILSEATDDEQQKEIPADERGAQAEENRQKSGVSNISQREIIEQAIEDQDSPTEDDVLAYAADYGLSRDKAQRLLRKMQQHGEVRESSDYILRLI